MLPDWVAKFNDYFQEEGMELPRWWPSFLDVDFTIQEDAILMQFTDNYN